MLLTKGKKYQIMFEWDKCIVTSPFITPIGRNEGLLSITSEELMEAIITCGIPWFNLTPCNIKKRERELYYKYDLIEFALTEDVATHRIVLNEAAINSLDSSEKTAISYYLGMFFTKLISKKIFDVDFLVHLKTAEKYTKVCYKTKERPDFIGYTYNSSGHSQYSLFEAKGRQNKVLSTLDKAIDQLNVVSYISGKIPSPRVASMVHFKKNGLIVTVVDPSDAENEDSIEISANGIIRTYYSPIIELLHEGDYRIKNERDREIERTFDFGEETSIRIAFKQSYLNLIESDELQFVVEDPLSIDFV